MLKDSVFVLSQLCTLWLYPSTSFPPQSRRGRRPRPIEGKETWFCIIPTWLRDQGKSELWCSGSSSPREGRRASCLWTEYKSCRGHFHPESHMFDTPKLTFHHFTVWTSHLKMGMLHTWNSSPVSSDFLFFFFFYTKWCKEISWLCECQRDTPPVLECHDNLINIFKISGTTNTGDL